MAAGNVRGNLTLSQKKKKKKTYQALSTFISIYADPIKSLSVKIKDIGDAGINTYIYVLRPLITLTTEASLQNLYTLMRVNLQD